MTNNNLNNEKGENAGYLEKLLDASGAAVGTGIASNAVLGGAPLYAALLSYVVPYGLFKAAKYAVNVAKHPIKSLSPTGIGNAIQDAYSNFIPYKQRVPAGVGVVSGSTNYSGLGSRLIGYLSGAY